MNDILTRIEESVEEDVPEGDARTTLATPLIREIRGLYKSYIQQVLLEHRLEQAHVILRTLIKIFKRKHKVYNDVDNVM